MSMLEEFDYTVVVDTSSSMGEPYKNTTRWLSMQESAMGLVREIEKLDSDGIDVVQLGGQCKTYKGVTSQNIREMFATMNPRGSTPLAQALTAAFAHTGNKKKFIVVFTDGVPDDEAEAASVIRKQANSQANDDDCTVLFIQVGDDKHATQYLKGLDDNLKGAKFDIVDVKTIEEAESFADIRSLIEAAIAD